MFKYPALTFQDLLTARGTRAPTASQKRIEDFEDFLKNRKKKEETDELQQLYHIIQVDQCFLYS